MIELSLHQFKKDASVCVPSFVFGGWKESEDLVYLETVSKYIAWPSHWSADSLKGGAGSSASSVLRVGLGLELVPREGGRMGSRERMKWEGRNTPCLLWVPHLLELAAWSWGEG